MDGAMKRGEACSAGQRLPLEYLEYSDATGFGLNSCVACGMPGWTPA